MPVYVFACKKCGLTYEQLTAYDPAGKYRKVRCPDCKSASKERRPTVCREVIFTEPRGTSKADSFSYVAGYNMEQAKAERRRAEQTDHMGANPYNPLPDGDHFDFSKI